MRDFRPPFVLAIAIVVAACSDPDGPATPGATRLTIEPADSTFSLGRRVPFIATAYDARDSIIATGTISWTSSAPAVATVSNTGVVTARAEGRTTITATFGNIHADASVRVTSTRLIAFFQHKYCAIRSDDRVFCNNLEAFQPGPKVPVPMNVVLVDLAVGDEHA